MRKLVFSVLLASAAVATPTLAAPGDYQDRQAARQSARQDRQTREDRKSTREDRRSSREDRQSKVEAPQVADRAAVQVRQQVRGQVAPAVQVGGQVRQRGPADAKTAIRQRVEERQAQAARDRTDRNSAREIRSDRRQASAEQIREQTRQIREARQAARANRPPPVVSSTPRPNTQPPPPPVASRPTPTPQWNGNWRNNSRYDWKNYRHRHYSLFNLGYYYDPFGWGYSPYQVGWRMWPSYFSNNYWLNDPWQYRLPYAPPGTRWIRYYDDAVLVDMWSGQVVDVIYSFFW